MKIKAVGNRSTAKKADEFHTLGTKPDRKAKLPDPNRLRGVFKFRTWQDLEEWENNRRIEQSQRMHLK